MIKYYSLLAFIFLSFTATAASFVEGLEDIPIPADTQQVSNDTISFGNEDSRLVEVMLTSSRIDFKKVSSFYKNTLPQMGWLYQGSREQTLIFEREGEVLEIAKESASPLRVRLTVKSKI